MGYRFNKEQKERYNELVAKFYAEGSFLKDARAKARAYVEGAIFSERLEKARREKRTK